MCEEAESDDIEDTYVCSKSHVAAIYAAAVVCHAVDILFDPKYPMKSAEEDFSSGSDGEIGHNEKKSNETIDEVNQKFRLSWCKAFCLIRPPGHHVGRDGRTSGCCSHGFCLLNNVAIGIAHAKMNWGVKRFAIIDFDVHFGNGTYEIFKDDSDVFFSSVHMQSPPDAENDFFAATLPGNDRIDASTCCVPVLGMYDSNESNESNPDKNATIKDDVAWAKASRHSQLTPGRTGFCAAVTKFILPRLRQFNPEVIFLSSGFDAHEDDPLGGSMRLMEEDYDWITRQIVKTAEDPTLRCRGRIISVLEGGYDVSASNGLARCVAAHVNALSASTQVNV